MNALYVERVLFICLQEDMNLTEEKKHPLKQLSMERKISMLTMQENTIVSVAVNFIMTLQEGSSMTSCAQLKVQKSCI